MRKKNLRRILNISIVTIMMAGLLAGCSAASSGGDGGNTVVTESQADETDDNVSDASDTDSKGEIDSSSVDTEHFTGRDLEQTADTSDATLLELKDGEDFVISTEGVYVLSGKVSEATVIVEAGDEDKVEIVLDGAEITNETAPAIYVKSADKVFVTTTDSENTLTVTGTFEADGDTNVDAVIFSKDDLVIKGTGTLNITSSDNAVSCKDTLKITGSTVNVSCEGNAFEAHDAIEVADGNINISKCNDGLHAEDNDDDTIGAVYIAGGNIDITAADDAVHGTTTLTVDGGTFNINAAEGLEATYIEINGGDINIEASDDGINAAAKSGSYTPTFIMNDGNVVIKMGQGDTDGIDSNGDIYVNGGTIDITGQSGFDYDGKAEHNGGTIIVNGTETDEISNQFGGMGPGGMGRGGDGNFQQGGDENFQPGGDGNFQPGDGMQPPEGDDSNFRPGRGGKGGNMQPPEGDESNFKPDRGGKGRNNEETTTE